MNDSLSTTPVELTGAELPTIKLWTPRLISIVTLLVGFPSGLVLTSINCLRMSLRSKALVRLAAAAAGTFVFVLLILLTPGSAARLIGLVANFGMIYYLQTQTQKDLRQLKATGATVQKANWFGGLLIGVLVLGLWLAAAFVLLVFLEIVGVSIPE